MSGHGIEIEATDTSEEIEEPHGEMLDAMATIDRLGGIETYSKDGVTVGAVVAVDMYEATEMSLQCKWPVAIGRRVLHLHPRRRNPPQT